LAALRQLSAASLLAIAALGILVLGPLLAEGASAPIGQEQTIYPGSLLYLSRGGIWQMNLATLQRQPFLDVPNATVTHVSHSWDHQRVAYSTSVRGAGFELLESSIVVAAADGSNPRTVVQESRSGATVEWPSWSPDGSRLVYTKTLLASRIPRVEEVDLATEARTLIAEAGSSPAYSADGESIVYASPAARTWSIWKAPRGGDGPTVLVADNGFEDVDYPLYARGGDFVAFIAAGPGPDPVSSGRARTVGAIALARLLSVARAHPVLGAEFDLWTVRPDGSVLSRAAELLSEEPYISWSPDGRYLAAWGRLGLQIVDATNGSSTGFPVQWLTALPSGGPISWGP
jgi:Tol biopolymer transport system component